MHRFRAKPTWKVPRLSSISLTIPAVLIIGFLTDKTVIVGLDASDMVMLLLTLVVSMLTFALERTMSCKGRFISYSFSLT